MQHSSTKRLHQKDVPNEKEEEMSSIGNVDDEKRQEETDEKDRKEDDGQGQMLGN